MKKIIKSFIKEIVPIILGILIALYINNWNENRKDEKYINKMITSIDKELKDSNKDIEEKIPLQKRLIDTLDFYKNDDKTSILDVMMKVDGIHIPSIKINSWKAISSSKIELVEYNRISTMADIEEGKENLLLKTRLLMDFTYQNIKETDIDKKEFVLLMMQDIIISEIGLQEEIEGIIKD
jgi:hypothetical protein